MAFINKPSLTENNLAERWGVSIKTLQDWRRQGKPPMYLKLGKSVRYPIEIIEKFEDEHLSNQGGVK